MRDSILNVKSSGLGGVVHEVKRGARKVDKFNASVSRHIEKKKKEHYRTKKAKINLANKNLAAQNREIEKGRLRRAKIRDKEVADRMKVLNRPKPEPKEKHGYYRNEWGDITYY